MADARGSTATVKLGAHARRRPRRRVHRVAAPSSPSAASSPPTRRAATTRHAATADGTADEERRLPEARPRATLDVARAEADGHETEPRRRATPRPPWSRRWRSGASAARRPTPRPSAHPGPRLRHHRGQALVPTWLAFAVTRLLEEHFDRLVDYDFTASMEEDLDRIAAGDEDRVAWLNRFYFGDGRATRRARVCGTSSRPRRDRRPRDQLDPDRRRHRRAGRPLRPLPRGLRRRARRGRHHASAPRCPTTLAPDELTAAKARELLETQPEGDQVLGTDPVDRHADRRATAATAPTSPRSCPTGDRHDPVGRRAEARAGRRPSRAPRRCSRPWSSQTITSTPRSGCCRCRASSASTPRPAPRSPRRTAATAPT